MTLPRSICILAIGAAISLAQFGAAAEDSGWYFAIQVVDDQTGRGVPMVELQTTGRASYYTDSNGLVAFYEPGAMNRKVWFSVAAHGYEMPANPFGLRGAMLDLKPGGSATIKIHRINIAERLYRLTGQGIYRDTVLLGRRPPIDQPLLNAEITGKDGTLNAIYCRRLYWFFGDTDRLSFPRGNFATTGATSDPPQKLDPELGINLHYFAASDGFARPMVSMPGPGVVWLYGVVALPDETGREQMVAFFQRRQGLGPLFENGFVRFDDRTQTFHKFRSLPLDPPIFPKEYPFRVELDGQAYIYFTDPYPMLRVRADLKSYLDLAAYEGYTCLKPGARYGKG